MIDARISEISFEEITPFWLNLWWWHTPETLERFSYMRFGGGHFNEVKDPEIAYFGIQSRGEVVGVNSIHTLPDGTCRSRGLWVDPNHRGKGLGFALLHHSIGWAENRGFWSWSYPRESSLDTYLSAGYESSSDWIVSEHGIKNKFVRKSLDKLVEI